MNWYCLKTVKPQPDIFGQCFVARGRTVTRMNIDQIDRTWTHWAATGIDSLPIDGLKEFNDWYDSKMGSHRSEQQTAFIAGYNQGKL